MSPSDFRERRDYPTLAQVAQLWLAGFAADKKPMTASELMRDLADKVLDGTFEVIDPVTGDVQVETFTLMGSELSAHAATFKYEVGVRKENKTDRDTALAEFAHKIRIAPDGLLRWQKTEDFSAWARLRGLPPLDFNKVDASTHPTRARSVPVLTKAHASKGGQRPKFNLGLQEAVNRIAADLDAGKQVLTTSSLKDWIRAQTERNRDPATDDVLGKASGITLTPYAFEPPIPDCDDLYIDGKKLVWRDRDGRERHCSLRSLEPYVQRATERAQR